MLEALSSACREALPIWAKQIAAARRQMEAAVTSVAGRFSGIVNRLDASARASESVASGSAVQLIGDSRSELGGVVDTLKAVRKSRESLTVRVRELGRFTAELSEMAKAVETLAFQTNVLALNAAIEAAHAGEMGKGFAVVAQEVRHLSNASRDTGKKITEKLNVLSGSLGSIMEENEKMAEHDHASVERTEELINGVLTRFGEVTEQLIENSARMRDDSRGIKDEIAGSLVQLQFQDRVGQILAHSEQAMANLSAHLNGRPSPESVREFVSSMKSTYTTEEQRRIHHGARERDVAPQEVVFF